MARLLLASSPVGLRCCLIQVIPWGKAWKGRLAPRCSAYIKKAHLMVGFFYVWRTRKDSNPISPVTKPFYLYTLLSLTYTVPLSINLKQPLCVRLCVHYIAINGAGGLPRGGEGGCCELVIVTVSGEIHETPILNH